MSRQFYSQVVLRLIAATGGNTIDTISNGTTGSGYQLLGFPIWFSDQAEIASSSGDKVCYFGDWENAAVFGNRQSIEVATSEHVNFAEDQINIRATARWDIDVHDATAFSALITA
jgi:HK97 family phage major capsid protein